MKLFFRYFFRSIRLVLGPILLLGDKLTTPKGITRAPELQEKVDDKTENLVLFQFKTCPFCIKVRRAIKRLSLNIETLDAQHNDSNRQSLLNEGGKIKVPCLKITANDGNATWLYESEDIIRYLQENFA